MPLGALLLALAAWLVADAARRLAPRVLPAAAGRAEELLRMLLVAVLMAVSAAAVLGLAGVLYAVAILVLYVYFFQRLPTPVTVEGGAPVPPEIRWPAALTLLLLAADLLAYLPASPVDWDAATYHLYLPARWLQEGRLFHMPTPFGDNAAAFAPQNGALYFAWQMALTGRDAVVNISQLLCLAFLGLALYRACRLLGTDRGPAALAALTLPWLAPVRRWTYSANVDVFMVAFAFGALYWALLYRRKPERPTAVAAGLAAGLAAGTKTLGLPLAAVQALPLAWTAVRSRRLADLGAFLGCALIGGGWWYLFNFWRYANPLFPVEVSLGPVKLPGAYGAAAIRAGEFHLESPAEVMAAVVARYGAPTCVLMILGLLALAWRAASGFGRRGGGSARVLLLQALAWGLFFAVVVPHNDQARLLMPTLAASLAGWSLVLARAGRRSPARAGLVWLVAVAVLALASRPWDGWTASFDALARAGIDAGRWTLTAILGLAAGAGAWALRRRVGSRPAIATGMAAVWGVLTIATLHADASRAAYFAAADYRGWAEGYLPFNDPARPPARVAYTGANVPYALAGAGWRHRVVYLDTQGEQGDGYYQHWRRDPRRYPYHKPGLYRGHDDPEVWLRHLEEQGVDTLVIFRLHRAEARYLRSTPDGFPIEQAWVRRRPGRFEPILLGRAAEIYRVSPPPDR